MISAPNQNLSCHHCNVCVTSSYFSQTHARSRHFLIKTADKTAVDEPTSLNKKGLSYAACVEVCEKAGHKTGFLVPECVYNCLARQLEPPVPNMVW